MYLPCFFQLSGAQFGVKIHRPPLSFKLLMHFKLRPSESWTTVGGSWAVAWKYPLLNIGNQ
jgi:hypothetical protein